jgi:hypothetical protein
MEPGTNFVALLPMGGRWRRMARVLGHDRDKGSDSERDCGRDSLSYMWASRLPSAATGSARCASSAELGDDCRPTPPPVSRYMQPTPARHSRICASSRHPHDTRGFAQARNCPGRLQPVQTLRRHPTGVPPPVRAQIQYRANLAECLGFDSDLSETSGISNKSYGFEPCVR